LTSTTAHASQRKPDQRLVLLDLAPLFTASSFQGIGRYLRELLPALVRLASQQASCITVAGLDTRRLPWQVVEGDVLASILEAAPETSTSSLPAPWKRRLAGRALARLGAACLHQVEPRQVPITGGIPLVLTYHDLIPLELPQLYSRRFPAFRFALNWLITRWRLRLASHVVVVSHYVAQALHRLFSFPGERITVAYNGVDFQRFSPDPSPEEAAQLRAKWGLEPGYWLFVGTGDPRKNLPFLLAAAAASGGKTPVVLAGKIHPTLHWPAIERAIAQTGVGKRVRVLGFVEEGWLPALYRQSLGLAFPSLAEGFGLPVLEAMACGKPVVAFETTSIPEVAGDAAWLTKPQDLAAFSQAMAELERSEEKRKALGEKAIRQAQRFSWDNTATKVLSAYREVLRLPC